MKWEGFWMTIQVWPRLRATLQYPLGAAFAEVQGRH
jgi:hypothetical protein